MRPQRRGRLCPGGKFRRFRDCRFRRYHCRIDDGSHNSGDGCCNRFAPDHREVTVTVPEGYSSMQTARLPE